MVHEVADHDFAALTANAQEAWTLFAIRFHDRAGCGELRKQHLQAHLEWVAAHRDTVRVAGSLRESPESTPVGGLWVVRAPDRPTVEALIATDPFTACGLRERWEIYYWSKALPEATSF